MVAARGLPCTASTARPQREGGGDDAVGEDRPEVVARIISFANDNGFALTEDDLVIETPAEGELVDEELAVVAGGGCGDCTWGNLLE